MILFLLVATDDLYAISVGDFKDNARLSDPSIRGTLLRRAVYDKDGIDADDLAF